VPNENRTTWCSHGPTSKDYLAPSPGERGKAKPLGAALALNGRFVTYGFGELDTGSGLCGWLAFGPSQGFVPIGGITEVCMSKLSSTRRTRPDAFASSTKAVA